MPTIIYMLVEGLVFALEEKGHEFRICGVKDLCLVCLGNNGFTVFAGGHMA